MIAIIDYGMGNLRSVEKAFAAVGCQAVVTRNPHVIADASHVVLPGVGAFADCMANLHQYGLIDPIRKAVAAGKPFLGICLGLQLLFTESEEFGLHKGLDLVPGKVKRFPFGGHMQDRECHQTGSRLKVPHMGWNAVMIKHKAPPLHTIQPGTYFYFVHSYYVEPQDPSVVSTLTEYGFPFASSIWRDNIFACQFHPEKSQLPGLQLIKNFAEWR